MKSEDLKNYGILAALGIGGVLVYNLLKKVPDTLTTWGEAIGSGLYDLFHPNQMGEVKFFAVRFPDGTNHSIPASWVDSLGTFVNRTDPNNLLYKGDGKTYRIVKKAGGGAVVLVAFPA